MVVGIVANGLGVVNPRELVELGERAVGGVNFEEGVVGVNVTGPVQRAIGLLAGDGDEPPRLGARNSGAKRTLERAVARKSFLRKRWFINNPPMV